MIRLLEAGEEISPEWAGIVFLLKKRGENMVAKANAIRKRHGNNGATLGFEAKLEKAIWANLKELGYGE